MRPLRRVLVVALPAAVVLGVCCGVPLYLLRHWQMQDTPELVCRHYERELQEYGRRLQAGEVRYVEGRGYGLPRYLIAHGARYCTRHGDCFCVWFGFILDDLVPQLWFSPNGFDPMPEEIAEQTRPRYARWEQLSPQWGACYTP
jgi:hypothetical protein